MFEFIKKFYWIFISLTITIIVALLAGFAKEVSRIDIGNPFSYVNTDNNNMYAVTMHILMDF